MLIDVRAPRERDQKRIAGSLSIPLNHLAERPSELPADRPLLVYCAGGYRSSIAASLLQQHGFTHVGEIAGGIAAWEAAKLPDRDSETPRARPRLGSCRPNAIAEADRGGRAMLRQAVGRRVPGHSQHSWTSCDDRA